MPPVLPDEPVSPRAANTPLAAHGLINAETFEYHVQNRTLSPFPDSGSDVGSHRRLHRDGSFASSDYAATPESSAGRTMQAGELYNSDQDGGLSDSDVLRRNPSNLSSISSSLRSITSAGAELRPRPQPIESDYQAGASSVFPNTIQQIIVKLTQESSAANHSRLQNLIQFYNSSISVLQNMLHDTSQTVLLVPPFHVRDAALRDLVMMRDMKRVLEAALQSHSNPREYSRRFRTFTEVVRGYFQQCSGGRSLPGGWGNVTWYERGGGRGVDVGQDVGTQRLPSRGDIASDLSQSFATSLRLAAIRRPGPSTEGQNIDSAPSSSPSGRGRLSRGQRQSTRREDAVGYAESYATAPQVAAATNAPLGPSDLPFAALSAGNTSTQRRAGQQGLTHHPRPVATASPSQGSPGPSYTETHATTVPASVRRAPGSRQVSTHSQGPSIAAVAIPTVPETTTNARGGSADASPRPRGRAPYISGVDGTVIRTEADVQRFLRNSSPDRYAMARDSIAEQRALRRSPRFDDVHSWATARQPDRNVDAGRGNSSPQSASGPERPDARRRGSERRRRGA